MNCIKVLHFVQWLKDKPEVLDMLMDSTKAMNIPDFLYISLKITLYVPNFLKYSLSCKMFNYVGRVKTIIYFNSICTNVKCLIEFKIGYFEVCIRPQPFITEG